MIAGWRARLCDDAVLPIKARADRGRLYCKLLEYPGKDTGEDPAGK